MALRPVTDFDEKQWAQLQKMMREGPTKQQLETIEEAKLSRNIKIKF